MVTAIIVAGGRGRRMAGEVRKQYLDLGGRPIWHYALAAFSACAAVDNIIMVVPADDLETCRAEVSRHFQAGSPITVIPGGARRQDSVFCGLKAMEKGHRAPTGTDIVVVHDAVRPFIDSDQIMACIKGAREHGACILGIQAIDTLKRITPDSMIESTLERRHIWMAQTPQAFQYQVLIEAHTHARDHNITGTDDAGLVENLGHKVKVTPGSRFNLKITTPQDYQLAQAIVAAGILCE